jgi:Domain of unknown function (DUF4440)
MIALAAALAASVSFAAPPPSLVAEFRARDQALLNAVTSGDRAVWDRAMDPDAIYVDEGGAITTKAGLLAQILPLPAGDGGHITITGYTLHVSDDVAVVVHRNAEVEEWHGQTLRLRAGEWKLVLSHVYVAAKAPPAIRLPANELDEYVGRYQAGPGVVAVVGREGDHLTIRDRKNKPAKPLLAEAQDLLFVPSEPRFHDLIQRDKTGKITGFIQRREGEDVHWTRLP